MRSAMYDPMVLESSLPYPKTLDESVLRVRAGGIQEVRLLENGVDENVTEADSGYMEVTARGGVEVAPFDPSHFNVPDSRSEPGEGAETEPGQEQEPTSLAKLHWKDSLVDEQQYEGCEGSLWKSRAGGSVGRAAKGRVEGEKKRKRCSKKSRAGGTNGRAERGARGEARGEKLRKNWTDEETLSLLQAVPVKSELRSRVDKFSGNEASWEGVAGAVSGRTGGECRRRIDTLKKAYKAIEQCCEKQQKEVSELTEKGFEDMIRNMPKLSTRFKRSWYDYVRDYCPPRAYKKLTNGGGGSPSEDAVNSDSCAPMLGELGTRGLEFHNPDADSRKVVTATRDLGERSKAGTEAFVVVALVGPHRSTDGELVGTPNSASPVLDPPPHTSPAHLQNHRGAQDGLPYLGGPPQYLFDDVIHVETSIEIVADANEPHHTSAVDLHDDWASAVDTSNVPYTDVAHLTGFADIFLAPDAGDLDCF